MDRNHGQVMNASALKNAYWRDDLAARREVLMPFLWTVVARQGQIFGNRDKGSDVYVTNHLNFSYPGYSETLCGFADPRVHSNDKIPNPNITVLEWLARRPEYQDKVAAFAAWDVFPYIFNQARAGFPVNAVYAPFTRVPSDLRIDLLNDLEQEITRVWDEEPFDAFPFQTALEYLKAQKPRLLFLSLSETDNWAHAGKYGEYLEAAHRADRYLRILWETAQAMPEYHDQTTLIFSPDHGRGKGKTWKDHGEGVPESRFIWMAFLGPDTPPLSEIGSFCSEFRKSPCARRLLRGTHFCGQ